jgi:hypothetical protein
MMADRDIALLLYGNGADLGNFKFFADDLSSQLVRKKKFDTTSILIKETLNRRTFFDAIKAVPAGTKIKALHVFSHSIGGGLYVGYKLQVSKDVRAAAFARSSKLGRRITYQEVLAAGIGGAIDLAMYVAKIDFVEAVKRLARTN